ncbi:hypothetical protein BJ875DRAFT_520415 [Amylocarpus encephaloides]|uniref:Uncharacterized protein n=1 Tax=Amylocarpus encephaloides TaxID=45428 RepID=A0A9P8C1W6_9HELO|nr:hypothetical protein BJ875DRAFT_520415 [Amylocarpus encephaloides]
MAGWHRGRREYQDMLEKLQSGSLYSKDDFEVTWLSFWGDNREAFQEEREEWRLWYTDSKAWKVFSFPEPVRMNEPDVLAVSSMPGSDIESQGTLVDDIASSVGDECYDKWDPSSGSDTNHSESDNSSSHIVHSEIHDACHSQDESANQSHHDPPHDRGMHQYKEATLGEAEQVNPEKKLHAQITEKNKNFKTNSSPSVAKKLCNRIVFPMEDLEVVDSAPKKVQSKKEHGKFTAKLRKQNITLQEKLRQVESERDAINDTIRLLEERKFKFESIELTELKNDELRKINAEIEQENTELQARVEVAEQGLDAANDRYNSLQTERDSQAGVLSRVRLRHALCLEQNNDLQAQVEDLGNRLLEKSRELYDYSNKSEDTIQSLEGELGHLSWVLRQDEDHRTEISRSRDACEEELDIAMQQLEQQNSELQNVKEDLEESAKNCEIFHNNSMEMEKDARNHAKMLATLNGDDAEAIAGARMAVVLAYIKARMFDLWAEKEGHRMDQ